MFGEIMADVSRLLRIPAASLNRGFYKQGCIVCGGTRGGGWCSLRAGIVYRRSCAPSIPVVSGSVRFLMV